MMSSPGNHTCKLWNASLDMLPAGKINNMSNQKIVALVEKVFSFSIYSSTK